MTKSITIYHFYWRFIQLNCFNSHWRKMYPSLRIKCVYCTEIGPKIFDKFKPEPGPTLKGQPDLQFWSAPPFHHQHLASHCNALILRTQQCFHGKNRPITYRESEWCHHRYTFYNFAARYRSVAWGLGTTAVANAAHWCLALFWLSVDQKKIMSETYSRPA